VTVGEIRKIDLSEVGMKSLEQLNRRLGNQSGDELSCYRHPLLSFSVELNPLPNGRALPSRFALTPTFLALRLLTCKKRR